MVKYKFNKIFHDDRQLQEEELDDNLTTESMTKTEPKETKIEVENLNFFYGTLQALKNINLKIAKNQITAIIGASGCGKTTFLRCLNRMHDLYAANGYRGKIMLHPEKINIIDSKIDPILIRMRIGMVFQKPNPFPKSVFENVAYGLRVKGIKNKKLINEKIEWALHASALWEEVKDRLNENAYSLSGGQQQRLCIARAIAVEPDVLLFDEPTSALDPVATSKIEELAIALKKEITIVIVTHNMQQAARIADFTAFMHLGELIEFDITEKIYTNPSNKLTEDYVTGRFG